MRNDLTGYCMTIKLIQNYHVVCHNEKYLPCNFQFFLIRISLTCRCSAHRDFSAARGCLIRAQRCLDRKKKQTMHTLALSCCLMPIATSFILSFAHSYAVFVLITLEYTCFHCVTDLLSILLSFTHCVCSHCHFDLQACHSSYF